MKQICQLTIIGRQNAEKLCQTLLDSDYIVKSEMIDLGGQKFRWLVTVYEIANE